MAHLVYTMCVMCSGLPVEPAVVFTSSATEAPEVALAMESVAGPLVSIATSSHPARSSFWFWTLELVFTSRS